MSSGTPRTGSQRRSLRFCKAFFEVRDAEGTRRKLVEGGAVPIDEGPEDRGGCHWFLWEADLRGTEGLPFFVRLFAERLVLEGPSAEAVGRGWRKLAEWLEPLAIPRVAAGDDLSRFVPSPRRRSADRPETLDPEQRRQVLEEFYAAFHNRWVEQPHAALDGRSPRRVAEGDDPELFQRLLELLSRLERIEEMRRSRGEACFSVDRIRRHLGIDGSKGGSRSE